jgi:arylsulfatase A-like enzyme
MHRPLTIIACLIGLIVALAGRNLLAAEKPNVILIIADDQGYGDLSCHGNKMIKTPNMDKLHGESVRFNDFHVAPMCSPTRGEILTGMAAFRNGATAVCQGRSLPRCELTMLPQYFKENGYATGHFGKWHLGDNYPFRPQDRGFDLSIHNCAFGVKSLAEFWKNDCTDDKYWRNNQLEEFPGYNTNAFFREAATWMKSQTKPFFVYLPTTAAHSPFNVPKDYADAYPEVGPNVRNFYGMIANLDENLGKLEQFLADNNLRENTILIYMTDNGTVIGDRVFNAGMRGNKTTLYDGGHRVPLFVRWPAGKLGKPRDVEILAHSTDLLPTLVELCGLEMKEIAQFEGLSLAPLLRGEEPKQNFADRMAVVQYGLEFKKWNAAILWSKWRLVNGDELYNVADDPGQKQNVYEQHADVVKAMRDFYEDWCRRSEPLMNQTNFIRIGTPNEPVTWLSCCNWTGSYCDNWGNLASGVRLGHWSLEVDADGDYEVALYMFHPDAKTPLNKPLLNVPARPIAKAKLLIDGKPTVMEIKPDETHATFRVPLEKGQKLKLEGQFLSSEDKPLFGAAYTFVKKIP